MSVEKLDIEGAKCITNDAITCCDLSSVAAVKEQEAIFPPRHSFRMTEANKEATKLENRISTMGNSPYTKGAG